MPLKLSNGTLHYHHHEAEATPETLAYHAEQIAWWRREFPAMFDAPQPPQLPKVYGRFGIDMQNEFPGITAAFQFREPVSPPGELIQLTAIGHCLSPILNHGDAFWVDPHLTPQEFDLVAVAMTPEICEKFRQWGRQYPALREAYARAEDDPVSPIMTKMLRLMGSEWYFATNTSASPLDGVQVLGVIVRIKPGAGGGVCCAALPGDEETAGVSCTALPVNAVHSASASAVTVTQQYTLPVASLQTICSVTFTPGKSCEILCSGEMNFTHDMSDPVFEEIGYDVYISGTTKRYNAMSSYGRAGRPDSHSVSRTFSVTGGVSVTIILGAAKIASGTSFVIDHADFRVVELHS